ncbi:MAG TPA: hypothetical protein VH142_27955 [Polyangiaceae bacterium]|nr:hypothetical protein [Polyangiaceae bacterium]
MTERTTRSIARVFFRGAPWRRVASAGVLFAMGFGFPRVALAVPNHRAATPPANATPSTESVEQSVVLEDDDDSSNDDDEKTPSKKPATAANPKQKDAHADDDETTNDAVPAKDEPSRATAPVVWLTVGLSQDIAFLSGSDVCSEQSQLSSFTCLRASGSQYHGTPVAGAGDSVGFAPALGGTRVTLALDAPLSKKLSAGLRLGYAFAGRGPNPDGGRAYLPIQAEAQAAYWLSSEAFATSAPGVFIEASAGLEEVDGKRTTTVQENGQVPPPANQIDNPPTQTLDVYRKAGDGFVGAGVGAFVPFGRAFGLLGDLRLGVFFPTSGVALSLNISAALGL